MRPRLACSPVIVVALFTLAAPAASAAPRDYAYLSPAPGAERVSPGNNIAFREGSPIDPASLVPGLVRVSGVRSGQHTGRLALSSDERTVLFTPDQPFALGEHVRVRIATGARTRAGRTLPTLSYEFQVSSVDPRAMPRPRREWLPEARDPAAWWQEPAAPSASLALPCDTLLPAFPSISLVNANAQSPGVYFMAPFVLGNQVTANLQVLDDLGKPLFQRVFQNNFLPVDFKVQPNGRLTFWLNGAYKFYAMDSAYAIVDSFVCGNGYLTDLHELMILPDGHALMMSYDAQPVGMDTVVVGGDPNALVHGLVVQELDVNKNVVFQWRSWDHFQITDGSVSPLVDLLSNNIDYVHANSIDKGSDGNLVISNRHMNEITKIDRQTGAVIWRMGMHATNNQWLFPNDARGFSHTHDARVQPNGNLTLFDNGNYLAPQYSRAVEYQLDEVNRIATLVWEYRHTPDIYGGFMGNVQRHPDGSTTIGWGGPFNTLLKAADLHADGSTAAEFQFPPTEVNYRMFRFPWRTNRFLTDMSDVAIEAPGVGSSAGQTLKVWNNWDRPIDITCLRTAHSNFGATPASGSLPITLAPGETTLVQVIYAPEGPGTADSRLYVMQVSDGEIVAQSVNLHGSIGGSVGVTTEREFLLSASVRPNPARDGATFEYSVPAPGRVTLELYDVSGRRVAMLVQGHRTAGRHTSEWRVGERAPGLYFSRLTTGGRTLVGKVVVGD